MPETVLIEFVSDISQLAPAVDKLEQMGQVEKAAADQFRATNKTIQDQGRVVKLTADEFKKSGLTLEQLVAKVKRSTTDTQKFLDIEKQLKGELEKVRAELKQVVEQLDKLKNKEKETDSASQSLKSQLRQLVEQLAQMKVAGQDNTEQYRLLAQQAGKLKDAIGDANQEVKNFGSDTSTLDGVISLAGGIAGGFAVVQGAAALFGDESEELQKTLLRVNAAMAILQGLQQLQTVLQKESAAATLANTIATKARTAAQAAFNFVVGTSTGVMKAFRIALAATGVGLLVIGITTLIQKLDLFAGTAKKTANDLQTLRDQVQALNEDINRLGDDAQRDTNLAIAALRAKGATDKEIYEAERKLLKENLDLKLAAENNIQDAAFAALANAQDAKAEAKIKETQEFKDLQKDLANAEKERRDAKTALDILDFDFTGKLREKELDEQKKAIDDAKKLREEADRLAKEQRAAGFADFKAGLELQLLAAEEGSDEQLELKKRLLLASLQIDLENEKLTTNQRKLLIQEFFKERINLEKNFFSEIKRLTIEQTISNLQAELQTLELSGQRKLEVTEETIRLSAELEVQAANGNVEKIKEINAKRDKAIRDARISSIQEALDYELQSAEVGNAATVRALTRRLADEKTTLQDRIAIIDELSDYDSSAIQKRIAALNDERKQGLISQKDYDLQYKELVDEQTKVWEDAEEKKTAATKKAADERKQRTIQEIQAIVEAVTSVVDVLDSLFQLQSSRENDSLNQQKKQLKDLQDAGAITEKEAITRQKRIEAEEKRVRQQQAVRDKQIAVFKALLAIPQAILTGLSQGGPILAAIYGALAGVQAAIVIARPIPKFGKGKKDKYEGFGEVGETGTELIERNGRMYVADKSQVVWLGKNDKVYNPQETQKMLGRSAMNTSRPELIIEKKKPEFDYKKLGKEIGKHTSTTVYVDGYREQQIQKELFTRDLNKRRSW